MKRLLPLLVLAVVWVVLLFGAIFHERLSEKINRSTFRSEPLAKGGVKNVLHSQSR